MGRETKDSKKLNEKQARFVKEYVLSLNISDAMIKAGYSPKTAGVCGSKLLKITKIADAVAKAQANLEKRIDISSEKIMQELAIIGFSDIQNYLIINADTGAIRAKSFEEMLPGMSRAIESIKEDRVIKESADGRSTTVYDKFYFKLHSKTAAIELMMKRLGMLLQKLELSGKVESGLQYEEALKIFQAVSNGDPAALGPGDQDAKPQ